MKTLTRRVAGLEARRLPREPPEPVFTPEDREVARAIMDRTLADPVRYAKRIALFERIDREMRSGALPVGG